MKEISGSVMGGPRRGMWPRRRIWRLGIAPLLCCLSHRTQHPALPVPIPLCFPLFSAHLPNGTDGQPAVPKVQYFKRPDAFPYAVPAVVALLCLFFTLWAPGSAGEWARAFVARHMGRDFLKWIGYFAAGMVSRE